MSDPFVGEIQIFPYNFAPQGWVLCNGQLLDISDYQILYSLIGTTYGGDGQSNFAVPNLTGRVVISQGQGLGLPNYVLGQPVGTPTVTLTQQQMPSHIHALQLGVKTSTNATLGPTNGSNVAIDPGSNGFAASPINAALAPSAIVPVGGSLPHDNNQPTLAMIFCIATVGEFPQFQ